MSNKIPISILLFFPLVVLSIVAQQTPVDAPSGFSTPMLTVNPGSQSISNGIVEPPGDAFATDQAVFENIRDASTGLGPLFNGTSCVACHQNPVTGAASQITEIRVGHNDDNGNFVNPTVTINEGMNTVSGRSLINDRATCAQAEEHVPLSEPTRALRAVLNTLGDGFVEAIDDATLMGIAQSQPEQSGGLIRGEAIQVPVLEAPGQTRIGRFGWKNQHGSLLSFAADAYLNEMGVTNRLKPVDSTSVCKNNSGLEDQPDVNGLADIDHFAQFIRGTQAPPRDANMAATPDAQAGQRLFESVGCNICHVESIATLPTGTAINGGMLIVDAALGNKTIHPFGDYLLHDVGTGDGIVHAGPQDTADKLRTAPLWGLRTRSRYMHDLASLTLQDAIARHRGEARGVIRKFNALTATQRQQVIAFLNSL
jgi:CxxC motif-containing protein (DUF1111 family)